MMAVRCGRKILHSKLECSHLDQYSKWWNDVITKCKIQVTDVDILDKNVDRWIEEIPQRVYKIVTKLFGIETDIHHEDENKSEISTASCIYSLDSLKPKPSIITQTTLKKRAEKSNRETSFGRKIIDFGPVLRPNPYWRFYRSKEVKAAIWRKVQPLLFEEMDPEMRADILSNRIAQEFVDWLDKLSIRDPPNAKSITELFKIKAGINPFCNVIIKERYSVPDQVARAVGCPQKSSRVVFRRELKRDVKATKLQRKTFAFGRALSPKSQIRPSTHYDVSKCLTCKRFPEKLNTMESVWEGITDLTSTRLFCKFLYEKHPEITPPTYLTKENLINPKLFSKYSIMQTRSNTEI